MLAAITKLLSGFCHETKEEELKTSRVAVTQFKKIPSKNSIKNVDYRYINKYLYSYFLFQLNAPDIFII